MTLELILTGVGALVTGGSAVYASTRAKTVQALRQELKDMTHSWEEVRKEAHKLRGELQALEIDNAELKLRTNFEPVREKLENFMEVQRQVNLDQRNFNTATLSAMEKVSENQERLSTTLVNIMRKLVPSITDDELFRQEQPLHSNND